MACNRCGRCCMNPVVALHNLPVNGDKKEIGRWLQGHGVQIMKMDNGKEEVLAIQFNSICGHLAFEGNQTACRIYENRPVICREHICERAKDA